MSTHLDSHIKTWNRIHEQTKRIIAAAPNDKYDWKPCESAMSLGELVNHPWISEWGLIEATLTGSFPKEWPAPLNDTAAVLAAFDKAHEEAVAKVVALTPDQLAEDVDVEGAAGNEVSAFDVGESDAGAGGEAPSA